VTVQGKVYTTGPTQGIHDHLELEEDPRIAALEARVAALETPVPPPDPTPAPPPSVGTFGPAFEADSWDNRPVGRAENAALALRFRPSKPVTTTAVKLVERYGSGYSAGTGGRFRLSFQRENYAGVPDGMRIAETTVTPHGSTGFYTYSFTASLPADRVFLVIENVDANPSANYVSFNQVCIHEVHGAPRQPSGDELAVFAKTNSIPWQEYDGLTFHAGDGVIVVNGVCVDAPPPGVAYKDSPVFVIESTEIIGQGYGNPIVDTAGNYATRITGAASVRQSFVPTADRTITSAAFRVKRLSGTGGLVLTLTDASGLVLAADSISAANWPTSPAPGPGTTTSWAEPGQAGGRWGRMNFLSIPLRAGQTYYLEASAPTGTVYMAIPLLVAFPQATFGQGQAEKSSGTSWSTLGQPTDWQCYVA